MARDIPARSIRRLAAVYFALLLVAALAFAGVSWRVERDDQRADLESLMALTAKSTNAYFVGMRSALHTLGDEVLLLRKPDGGLDLPAVQRRLRQFHDHRPELSAANLIAVDGQVLATSVRPDLTGLPSIAGLRDMRAVAAAQRRTEPMELAAPVPGPVSQRWILPMRFALWSPDGELVAFLIAAVPVEMLQSFWAEAPVARQIVVSLARDDGYLLSRYPLADGITREALFGRPRTDNDVFRALQAAGFAGRGFVDGTNLLDEPGSRVGFRRLDDFPVTLLASVRRADLQFAWWQRVRLPLVAVVALAVLGAMVTVVVSRRESAWQASRAEFERRLAASEATLERAARLAGVGSWSLDLATGMVTSSARSAAILERPAGPPLDLETSMTFCDPAEREGFEATMRRAVEHGESWDVELAVRTATGRSIWVRSIGEREDVDGQPVRLNGAIQDVTESRRRREELERERLRRELSERHAQELAELLAEREAMLAVLAHEVRQPLNNASAAMQSAVSVIDAGPGAGLDAQPVRERLGRATVVIGEVIGAIDNALAAAALVAGHREIERADADVDTLLALVLADLPAADRARVRIERLTATRTASMDASLMRLALRNVVANALRHAGAAVRVMVRVRDSDEPLALVLEVTDDGQGVEPAVRDRLFERGIRGPDSAGQGLGLHIARRVMDLHGGSIELVDTGPHGSTFRLVVTQGDDA